MRNLLVNVALFIAAVAIGCNGSDRSVEPLTDSGFDGGIDGGPDGGIDGGRDGGIDAGLCDNSVERVPQEQRFHVGPIEDDGGLTPVFYQYNPPVQGMHYPIFARWQRYTETVPRGYWVHNLEHGAVVFLYRPDAGTELVQALTRIYDAIPNDPTCVPPDPVHRRVLLTPDPLLDVPWAVVAASPEPEDGGLLPDGGVDLGFGYRIKASCIQSEAALVQFAVEHRNMSVEQICDEGGYPPE